VAFPTETVYGLGADALNPKAVAHIFEVKRRPHFDPLILHVVNPRQAFSLWKEMPDPKVRRLIEAFWPGPLTIVLPKSKIVPDIVTSGLPTVAVRMPANEFALNLIRALDHPIAAPSANLFGYTSPTRAQAVWEDLGTKIGLVLDGGPAHVGLESTVLKIENGKAIVLRPGGVPVEKIRKFITVVQIRKTKIKDFESPGLLKSHYAPRTLFVLMDRKIPSFIEQLKAWRSRLKGKNVRWPKVGILFFQKKADRGLCTASETLTSKGDLCEAAANLFQAIRTLDKRGLDLMVAESVPERGIGLAIADRLKKATAGHSGVELFFKNWYNKMQNPRGRK